MIVPEEHLYGIWVILERFSLFPTNSTVRHVALQAVVEQLVPLKVNPTYIWRSLFFNAMTLTVTGGFTMMNSTNNSFLVVNML